MISGIRKKTDNLYTKEQASQCDLVLAQIKRRKRKKKKKRPVSEPNPTASEVIKTFFTKAPNNSNVEVVAEARQKYVISVVISTTV